MNKQEFEEFVLSEAKKYFLDEATSCDDELDEAKKALKKAKVPKVPTFKDPIKKATKKLKSAKTPKLPKVKEPMKVDESIAIDPEKIKTLAEEMKKINKKIDLRNPLINPEFFEKVIAETTEFEKPLVKEDQKKRWQNLFDYKIPQDDQR